MNVLTSSFTDLSVHKRHRTMEERSYTAGPQAILTQCMAEEGKTSAQHGCNHQVSVRSPSLCQICKSMSDLQVSVRSPSSSATTRCCRRTSVTATWCCRRTSVTATWCCSGCWHMVLQWMSAHVVTTEAKAANRLTTGDSRHPQLPATLTMRERCCRNSSI